MNRHMAVVARRYRLVLATGLAVLALAAGCSGGSDEPATRTATGSPELGRQAIRKYGCGSCHTIPGVKGAHALVGPPLDHFAKRTFVAGELANTAENLARWIEHPREVEPATAMPELGVSAEEARNIAAYLESIE